MVPCKYSWHLSLTCVRQPATLVRTSRATSPEPPLRELRNGPGQRSHGASPIARASHRAGMGGGDPPPPLPLRYPTPHPSSHGRGSPYNTEGGVATPPSSQPQHRRLLWNLRRQRYVLPARATRGGGIPTPPLLKGVPPPLARRGGPSPHLSLIRTIPLLPHPSLSGCTPPLPPQ